MVFEEFHRNGKIGVNSAFISLVPEKDRSITIKDYRSISFVSSLYEIITKVLSFWLNEVLGDTILEIQSASVRKS